MLRKSLPPPLSAEGDAASESKEVSHILRNGGAETDKFLTLLLNRNKTMNLTAVRNMDEARVRHTEDSAALFGAFDFKNKSVLDVGSGGGVPGIILRLLEPGIDLTLLDATGKKVSFLRECCDTLGLTDVKTVQARAEEYAHTTARESYDIVTARGVASLSILCELCLPLVKPGGIFLAMKETGEETADYTRFGGERTADYSYTLSNGLCHTVIRVLKREACDNKYPRTWKDIIKK